MDDVDFVEAQPLTALNQRLAGRRGAVIVLAAQHVVGHSARVVESFGEWVDRRVRPEQPTHLGGEYIVAPLAPGEHLSKPLLGIAKAIIRRGVEAAHARRPGRIENLCPGLVVMDLAERPRSHPHAGHVKPGSAKSGAFGGVHRAVSFEGLSVVIASATGGGR
jgi:hypothetical protein